MTYQSVQVSPEEAKKYTEFARKQHEAEQASHSGARTFVNPGVISMNTHDGVVHQQGVVRASSEDFKTPGVVGSLGWEPQSPKAVVSVQGIQMTLEDAFRHGFVGKDAAGQYFDLDSSKKAR